MSFNYVIYAEQRGGAPSAADIANAFSAGLQNARSAGGISTLSWVGPTPRITRVHDGGTPVTRAANVLTVDGPYTQDTADRFANGVGSGVYAMLLTVPSNVSSSGSSDTSYGAGYLLGQAVVGATSSGDSGWSQPAVTAYNEAANGSLAWWACGDAAASCASVTQTANEFAGVAGALTPDENPAGPTTDLTHPPTLFGPGATPFAQATSFLVTAAWIVGGATALYLAWPLLTGIRAGTSIASQGVKARVRSSRRRSSAMARSRTSYGF